MTLNSAHQRILKQSKWLIWASKLMLATQCHLSLRIWKAALMKPKQNKEKDLTVMTQKLQVKWSKHSVKAAQVHNGWQKDGMWYNLWLKRDGIKETEACLRAATSCLKSQPLATCPQHHLLWSVGCRWRHSVLQTSRLFWDRLWKHV